MPRSARCVVFVLWIRDRQSLVQTVARAEAERDAAVRSDALNATNSPAARLQLRDAFSALSRSALKENRDDFLGNAQTVLEPMKDALEKVQRHLNEVDKAREGSFRAVASELNLLRGAQEQLRASARRLVALARLTERPRRVGRDSASPHRRAGGHARRSAISRRKSARRPIPEAGRRRTSSCGCLATPRSWSTRKFPFRRTARRSTRKTKPRALESLDAHARQFRDHLRSLGAKEYWKQFQPAPQFVVMFLPLEPLLGAAFERDDSLFEQAASLRVVVATPMTLLALLKTVAYGWRQQEIATNAEEIQMLGRQLYERLASMVEHLDSVGRNLKQAAQSYDGLVGSLETKVLPGARRFKDLGVTSTKELEIVEPLRLEVRTVIKPELTGRPDAESASRHQPATARASVGRTRLLRDFDRHGHARLNLDFARRDRAWTRRQPRAV